MKQHYRIFFFFILLFDVMSTGANGQAVSFSDSLVWKISGYTNTKKNENNTLYCEFKTTSNVIIWVQDSGDDVNEFQITSTDGMWPDLSQDGTITFHVTWNDLPGTMRFSKSNGTTEIRMEINKDGLNLTPFVFTVSDVVKSL
jgi:hypothetical protein